MVLWRGIALSLLLHAVIVALHTGGGVGLHFIGGVGLSVQGEAGCGMAQQALDALNVSAGADGNRRAGVPEVVGPCVRASDGRSNFLEMLVKGPEDDVPPHAALIMLLRSYFFTFMPPVVLFAVSPCCRRSFVFVNALGYNMRC